jgi:uncharacterized protein (DUF2164 family)
MQKATRQWDLLSKDERRAVTREILLYFKKERDEEVGMIASEEFLDLILQNCGIMIYNKGVEDSQNFLKRKFEDLEIEMDLLKK